MSISFLKQYNKFLVLPIKLASVKLIYLETCFYFLELIEINK